MTDEQIKHMVQRFLGWSLPENFNPDAGISFEPVVNKGTSYEHRHNPVGTNLLDATQAEAMVRHMVEGLAASPVPEELRELSEKAREFVVPWTPTEAQWSGLARDIMMWQDFGPPHTPRRLLDHLRMLGRDIPQWLLDEGEMKALGHSVSKGTRCVLIYRAMLAAAPDHSLATRPSSEGVGESFQARVQPWMMECFGAKISSDMVERGDRLLEEVLELLQSSGYDFGRVAPLRDYVDARPIGEPSQEAGGVMVTLAAYCLAAGLDMHSAGETELARIWTKVEQIRAKQAAKPRHSPLPQVAALNKGSNHG